MIRHRSVRFVVGVAIVVATSAAPAHAQRALPDSIADLGALVSRLSLDGGYFNTDNLISNERGYQQVLNAMERLGVRGGAYIGVGPDQNYTYIARVRPRIAFIVDIRRDNMLQHLFFKALFARSATRAEYFALWTGRPMPPANVLRGDQSVDALVAWIDATPPTAASASRARSAVRQEAQHSGVKLSAGDLATIERIHEAFITEGLSLRFSSAGRAPRPYYPTLRQLILEHDASGRQRGYLASDADFRFVASMHRRNLIVPVTGDLANPRVLGGIGRYVAEHRERVSVLYASNVEDYLIRDGRFPAYVGAVRALPRDTNAVIIRSLFDGSFGHPESTPEYFSTQLLQRMDSFARDARVETVQRYRDLVLLSFVSLRIP